MTKLIPYPGFRSFRSDENYLFFGREGLTNEIINRLRIHKFVAVTGVSGSGKSSLVKAGLVPDLHRGLFGEAGTKWIDIQFSPKDAPIENLISSLSRDLPVKKGDNIPYIEKSIITSRSEGIIDYYELADTDSNILIVVDQFEELFRYEKISKESREKALFFVELLKQSTISKYPIFVVITMRSDFLGNCAGFPGLLELINDSQYLVPRLKRNELQRAIEEPAKIGKATYSNSLISSILNDVVDSQDQLPQLQHALRLTWLKYLEDKNNENIINQTHYESIGGMVGSLGNHAEKLYLGLNERQKEIIKSVFETITELGPERKAIRKPVSLETIHEITQYDLKELIDVIDIFRKEGANFLQPFEYDAKDLDKNSTIDISHESLINAWGTLKTWVDSEAKLVNRLRLIYDKIEIQGAGKEALLKGLDLDLGVFLIKNQKFNNHWVQNVMPIEVAKDEDYTLLVNNIRKYVDDSLVQDKENRKKDKIRARRKAVRTGYLIAAILVIITSFIMVSAAYMRNKIRIDRDYAEKQILLTKLRSNQFAVEKKIVLDSVNLIRLQILMEKKKSDSNLAKLTREKEELLRDARNRSMEMEIKLNHSKLTEIFANLKLASSNEETQKIRHDYRIYKCLDNASRCMDRKDANKAFRYAEYVIDVLGDKKNIDAIDFINRAFCSTFLGVGIENTYFSYPMIILADTLNKKTKILNIINNNFTIFAYNPKEEFIVKDSAKELFFRTASDSLIIYNTIEQKILFKLKVDSKINLISKPDSNYIFFSKKNGLVYYDIKIKRFNNIEFDSKSNTSSLFDILDYVLYYKDNKLVRRNFPGKKYIKYDLKKIAKEKLITHKEFYDFYKSKGVYRFPVIWEIRTKSFNYSNYYFSIDNILYWVNNMKLFGIIPYLSDEEIRDIDLTGESRKQINRNIDLIKQMDVKGSR